MLEVSKTKLKIIAYRLRDVGKILQVNLLEKKYNKKNSWESDCRIKEAEIIVRQASQDLLNILEGNDLRDVEKEIERLQRSLTN